jgi:hypothetical protein
MESKCDISESNRCNESHNLAAFPITHKVTVLRTGLEPVMTTLKVWRLNQLAQRNIFS